MLYRVHVNGLQGRLRLDFKLDDNPLVDLWLDCIKTQLGKPWAIDPLRWTRTWTTAESLAKAERELAETCRELNLEQHLGDLNRLHMLFHDYYEKGGSLNNTWNQLNKRIHKLEEQQRTLGVAAGQRTGFGMVVSDTYAVHVEQRPITEDLRPYWANSPRSGELLLGYYTLGKTIADCVRDNDVECVRAGMVRAQQQISTETMCLWGSTHPSIIKRVITFRQIEQWVKDKGLESYIDLSLPEHQYSGTPRLGQYIGSLTPQQINGYLEGADVVYVELIN